MRAQLWSGTGLAVLLAISMGAPSVAQETSTKGTTSKATAKTITVTGCIKQQSDVPELKTDLSVGNQADEFAITNVKSKTKMKGEPAQPTGTAGTTPTESTLLSYALTGAKEKDLKGHVGHQVEIVGKLETEDNLGTTPKASAGGTTGMAEKLPRINIRSFRHIADTCPAS